MSVALENKAPYKKVIGFAALVAEDGSKFSKSGPNNVSFNELADTYSADVLRYIFASNNMQNDTRFGLSICEEARRKLLSLWNTYVFFNTYAVIDNPKLDGYKPKNLDSTDKWLITYTNEFIRNATNYYENQQFFNIVKEFEVYIDDVSNWYIRINRRRFWKSEEEEDKLNAYYSLFYALKNVSRVLAPITPYLSEYIHQNLVRELEPNSKESVILESFPVADATYEDKSLLEKTDLARQIINIAQRLRNENNLKIKQPLKTMFLSLEKEQFEKVECFKQIILDELNIKEMVYEQSQSKFNEKYLTLNFKAAGSVLKGDVQTVKNLLQNANAEQMQQYVEMFENGNVNIDKFENLPSNLFVLCLKAKQDFVIGTENSLTVVLDITLDEELMLEGLMRELVRAIQVLRKESNLNIEQRIGLFVETEDVSVNKVLEKYKNKIMQETLANAFENFEDATIARTVSIGGEEVVVKIRG